jgi:hypothetical protein
MTVMWRFILRSLASLFMCAVLISPTLRAELTNRLNPSGATTDEDKKRAPPALQYAVASLSTILILVILCMPSRKRIN